MSSALNQLGLLLAGRRPGFAGARTPAWNPAQPNPYPPGGTGSSVEEDPQQRQPQQEDKSFLRSVYDGLVNNPMGPAFTLAMANTLTAPLRPGQTETGKWVESITQGYNSLGALSQLRAQQAAQARAEEREQAKIDQGWQKANADTQRVFDQGKEAEAQAEVAVGTLEETKRKNTASEAGDAEKRKNDLKIAEERARVATERFKMQMERERQRFQQAEAGNILKSKELDQQATYQGRMAGAAETNASANLKRAAADAMRAQVAIKAAEKGYTPEQTARILQIAGDRAELMTNTEFLGGDPKAAETLLNKKTDEVLAEFERISGRGTAQGAAQGGKSASTPQTPSNSPPKKGDSRQHMGATYVFDGQVWRLK